MSRDAAIDRARASFADGSFATDLARRVGLETVSTDPTKAAVLQDYLDHEMAPAFCAMGFALRQFSRPDAPGPIMVAQRIEDPNRPTVLMYGHGDVVAGVAEKWSPGLTPFTMTTRDEAWFGRGTADNKGQHSVNLTALAAVIAARGKLGFNLTYLFEMGEESGSPGLAQFCAEEAQLLQADMLIASDGPRIGLQQPTIFLGARGGLDLHLTVTAREGYYHSGNWGGLLSNPGIILAHAIAALVGPSGECLLPELTPGEIPADVRRALGRCQIETAPGDPQIEPAWGAPGLSAAEKLYGWSTLEVMEIEVGNLAHPLYAIPPKARARLQLRHPVGVDTAAVVPAIRRVLDAAGLPQVEVVADWDNTFPASRSDLNDPWVHFVSRSMHRTLGQAPVLLPNLGGSLPNTIFTDTLGLPTIWVPHSYPGCGQHGADEHIPFAIVKEGLAVMAGIFWDLGDAPDLTR